MPKPILTSLFIFVILILKLTYSGKGMAIANNIQGKGTLKIYGRIYDEDKKSLKGAEIEILKNNVSFQKQLTTANGKLEFNIPLNGEYVITVKLEGYLQKSIEIYTAVPNESMNKEHLLEFDVKMIKVTGKMDIEAMKKPVGLVFWNDEKKYFSFDKSLSIVYKKELDKKKEASKKTEESIEKTAITESKPIQKTEKNESTNQKNTATREEEITNLKKLEEEKQKKANEANYTQNQAIEEMLKKSKEIELEQKTKKTITSKQVITPQKLPEKNIFSTYADTIDIGVKNKQEAVTFYKSTQKENQVKREKQYSQSVAVEKTIESDALIERNRKEKELEKLKQSNPGLFENGLVLSNPPKVNEKIIDEFFSTVYQTVLIYPAKNDTFKRETGLLGGDSFYKNSMNISQKDYETMMELIQLIKK